MKKKITVTGANVVFLIFTALFIGSQFFLALLVNLLGWDQRVDFFTANIYSITFVNQYIFILLPPVIYALLVKSDFKETFRLKKLKILPAFLITIMAIPAYFTALALNALVLYLVQFIGTIPPQPVPVPQNIRELLTGLFFIALTPALCEEVFHRGMMLTAYEKRGSARAIVLTAIFFGLFHFDITNFLGPVFLGILIGYYVVRTDSILAGVLAHFLNNGFALLIQYMARNETQAIDAISITPGDLAGILIYGAVGVVLLYIFKGLFDKSTAMTFTFKKAISQKRNDIISVFSHWPVVLILCIYLLLAGMYFMTISML